MVAPDLSHHESRTFLIKSIGETTNYNYSPDYNNRKIDVEGMMFCLNLIDWDEMLNNHAVDLNGAVQIFYELLFAAIELNVPKIGAKSRKFPEWYTPELKNLIIAKKLLHLQWKITKDEQTYIEFKKSRATCIKLMRQAHKKHLVNIQHMAKYNFKDFWKF